MLPARPQKIHHLEPVISGVIYYTFVLGTFTRRLLFTAGKWGDCVVD